MKEKIRIALAVFLAVLTLTIGTGIIAMQTYKISSPDYSNPNLAAIQNQILAYNPNNAKNPNSLNPQDTLNPDLLNLTYPTKESVQVQIDAGFRTWMESSKERMANLDNMNNDIITQLFFQYLSENATAQTLFKHYDQLLSQEVSDNLTKTLTYTANHTDLIISEGEIIDEWNTTKTVNGTTYIQVSQVYALEINGTTETMLKVSLYDLNGTMISDPYIMMAWNWLFYWSWFYVLPIPIIYGLQYAVAIRYSPLETPHFLSMANRTLAYNVEHCPFQGYAEFLSEFDGIGHIIPGLTNIYDMILGPRWYLTGNEYSPVWYHRPNWNGTALTMMLPTFWTAADIYSLINSLGLTGGQFNLNGTAGSVFLLLKDLLDVVARLTGKVALGIVSKAFFITWIAMVVADVVLRMLAYRVEQQAKNDLEIMINTAAFNQQYDSNFGFLTLTIVHLDLIPQYPLAGIIDSWMRHYVVRADGVPIPILSYGGFVPMCPWEVAPLLVYFFTLLNALHFKNYQLGWFTMGGISEQKWISIITPLAQATLNLTTSPSNKGWFNSPVTIVISNSTPYVAKMGYDIDGEVWITEYPPPNEWIYWVPNDYPYGYNITINFEGVILLNLWTNNTNGHPLDGDNYEGKSSILLLIDWTPPVTTHNLNGNQDPSGWYHSNVTVTLTATDAVSGVSRTDYSLDGTHWFTYTGPFTISTEGITTVHYNSTDMAGNVENTNTVTVMVDKAPVTYIYLSREPGLNGTDTSNVIVTLVATDYGSGVSKTEYRLNDTNWTPYTGPFTITETGITTVHYNSTDVLGHVENTKTKIVVTGPQTINASLSGTQGLNGWYTSNVTVTLTTTENASNVARTEYSFDGVNWFVYNGSLTVFYRVYTKILGSETYSCCYSLNGVNWTYIDPLDTSNGSSLVSSIFTAFTGTPTYYNGPFTVSNTTTDETYKIQIAGQTIILHTIYTTFRINYNCTGTGPFTVSNEGVTTLYYRSVDGAGNVEPANIGLIMIDRVPPLTSASLSCESEFNGWYTSDVTVTLATTNGVSGVSKTAYSLDGVNWTTYTDPFTISAEGAITLYYNSTDNAGNVENTNKIIVMIDRTPPVTSMSPNGTLGLNGWYTSDVTVTLTAADGDSGVSRTEYSFDNTSWLVYNDSLTISTEGVTTLYYRSIDIAGNVENASTAKIMIDRTPPVTSISPNGTRGLNRWYTSDVTVTLTAADGDSGVYMMECCLDNNWFTYTDPFTISAEGAHLLVYVSIDNAGNMGNLSTMIVMVDRAPPVTTASLNGVKDLNGWYTSDVIVTLNATDTAAAASNVLNLNFILNAADSASVTNSTGVPIITSYSLDGNDWVIYTGPFTISTDGVHTLAYASIDNAGNAENISTETIMVQRAPLVTSISLSGTRGLNGWYTSDVTVTLMATDTASSVWITGYSLDGVNWTTYTDPFTISAEGAITLYYNSTDNAGNVENTNTITVMIDRTPPVTSMSPNGTLGLNDWYTSDVTVTLNATDTASSVWITGYRLDNNIWFPYTGSFTISADGVHTLAYASIDNAGNYNISTVTVMIDKSSPVTTASLSGIRGPNGWYTSDVTVKLTATDSNSGVSRTEYSYDGTNWFVYKGSLAISAEGATTLYYRSIDIASITENAITVTVMVDKAPPVTSISPSGTQDLNGWYTSNVTVTLTATDTTSGVSRTEYRLNDTQQWTTYTGPFTITKTGITTIHYRSFDVQGHVENTKTKIIVVHGPQTINASLSGTQDPNGWYTSNVAVTLTAADAGSDVYIMEYSLDGVNWFVYNGSLTVFYRVYTKMLDQNVDLCCYSLNGVNWTYIDDPLDISNFSSLVSSIVTAITGIPTCYNGPFTDLNTPTDEIVDIAGSKYHTVYTTLQITYTGTGSFIVSNEGVTTLYYRSVDGVGNVEPANIGIIMIDGTPPVTSISLSGTLDLNGWYTSGVTVALTAADAGSGVSRTEYSLDGTNWIPYTGPFIISAEKITTLCYRSVDCVGNVEPANIGIMIDGTPPVTSISLSGTQDLNGWYTSGVTVALTAADAGSGVSWTEYSLDGTNWIPYTGPFTITKTGITTIHYRSFDVQGHVENTKTKIIVVHGPQTINASLSGTQDPNGWYTSNVAVTLTAADAGSDVCIIEYSLDGVNWFVYNGSLTVFYRVYTKMFGSETYLCYYSLNGVNWTYTDPLDISNFSSLVSSIVTAITGIPTYYNGPFTDLNTTTDETYEMQILGQTLIFHTIYTTFQINYHYTGTGSFIVSNEGVTTLYYRSIDGAGNVEPANIGIIMIDRTPPVTTARLSSVSELSAWYTSDVTVALTAADAGSGVSWTEYSLDGTNWTPYTGPFTVSAEGVITLCYRSVDGVGNVEPANIGIMIDGTPPVTNISLSGAQGLSGWYTSDVTVTLTATDSASGVSWTEYSLDGTNWTPYTGPFTISAEGVITLCYRSVDGVGNVENTKTLTVKIDKTSPVTYLSIGTMEIVSEGYFMSTNATGLTFTATDSVSGVAHIYYRVNGGDWMEYNCAFDIHGQTGCNIIEYYSVDAAGNQGPLNTLTI